MPIYEFRCLECGKESEVLVRSAQWEGTECPECHSGELEKKLSIFSASKGGEMGVEGMACTGNPNACGRCVAE